MASCKAMAPNARAPCDADPLCSLTERRFTKCRGKPVNIMFTFCCLPKDLIVDIMANQLWGGFIHK